MVPAQLGPDSSFVQHAIPARSVALVQPHRQLLLGKLPEKHVDLGAYSIPSKTDLLIPPGYVNDSY
jgi:hypothetical protein